MANKIVPLNDKKVNFTIRLPYWLIKEIRAKEGYTEEITDILSRHYKKKENT